MTSPGLSHAATTAAGPVVVGAQASADACAAYVARHPSGRGYHLPAWLDVVRNAFGHRTVYLAAERDGAIVGVLPLVFFDSRLFGRSTVSMPFLNYGGVLA